ncbi:cobalamin biosynthesis protein, partial [Aquabacterium sp. A08]|nr:cobalamin biosynthesis protein [Aquabacterium sp. A08]
MAHVSPTPRLGPWLRGTAAWWLGAVAVAALAWALQTVALQHLGAWAALALALALKPLLA